jgi:hypothetical protein
MWATEMQELQIDLNFMLNSQTILHLQKKNASLQHQNLHHQTNLLLQVVESSGLFLQILRILQIKEVHCL